MENLMREKKYDNFRFERRPGSERLDLIPVVDLCKACADLHKAGHTLPNVKNVGGYVKNGGAGQCMACCQEFRRVNKYAGEVPSQIHRDFKTI